MWVGDVIDIDMYVSRNFNIVIIISSYTCHDSNHSDMGPLLRVWQTCLLFPGGFSLHPEPVAAAVWSEYTLQGRGGGRGEGRGSGIFDKDKVCMLTFIVGLKFQ